MPDRAHHDTLRLTAIDAVDDPITAKRSSRPVSAKPAEQRVTTWPSWTLATPAPLGHTGHVPAATSIAARLPMTLLFRAMKSDGKGMPSCGPSARMLGVRLEGDIEISDAAMVRAGTGGMSVALGRPENLPRHRRPPSFEGIGPDPVWQIDSDDLPDRLTMRPDPAKPRQHGFVEPADVMTVADYQAALAASREFWTLA